MLKKLSRSSHTSLLSSRLACLCAYTRQRERSSKTYIARFSKSKVLQPNMRTKKTKLMTISRKISLPGFFFFSGAGFAGDTFRRMRLYCLAIENHQSFIYYGTCWTYEGMFKVSFISLLYITRLEIAPLSIISYFYRLQKRLRKLCK